VQIQQRLSVRWSGMRRENTANGTPLLRIMTCVAGHHDKNTYVLLHQFLVTNCLIHTKVCVRACV